MWNALESVQNQCAATGVWKRRLGDHFELVTSSFFRRLDQPALAIWCEDCCCGHEVITHSDGKCVGVCQCDPWNCDNMNLSPEDVTLCELNWTKLGRAVARAFDCDWRESDFGLRRTRQIGSYGGAELPIILTIAHDRNEFRSFVAEVSARFRSGFILLSPTARFVTIATQEMLTNARAGFFDLETHTTLLPGGTIHALRSGAHLFSPYLTKRSDPIEKGEANRVFALMKTLDGGPKLRKAPLEQVFRLLIIQGRSQEAVAQHFRCSPSLISLRVTAIEKRLGRPLDDLRQFASSLVDLRPTETQPAMDD